MKTLYVIDGHALCYRAYFALIRNPLVNTKGQNVSAIHGFARMLYKLVQDRKPDYLTVAFDPPVKSFRFSLYSEYKATRHKMPDDLRSQIIEIRNMTDALGLVRLEHPEVEGDDIMGTIAQKYASDELQVWLVTGDKDAYQLLNRNVFIYAPKKGISEYEIYDHENIQAKTGVMPEQIIDYMSLTGDASDNIPGVHGIGEKTAGNLIRTYGSLDRILECAGEIKGRTGTLLAAGRENALLSRQLVTIKRDADIELDLEKAGTEDMFSPAAEKYFTDMEMPGIIKDYFHAAAAGEFQPRPAPVRNYVLVKTEDQLQEMIAGIREKGKCAVDTETTSVFPMEAELAGLSFSFSEGSGWYIPVISRGLFGGDFLSPDVSLALLKPVLEDENILKIGQNIKYDLIVLRNAGIELKGISFDTMIASYLLDPNAHRHSMDDLAEKYLNYKTITYEELAGTGKNAMSITEVPLDRVCEYAAEDADITWRLYGIFSEKLKQEGLEDLFRNMEMKLMTVLADMEMTGVGIDRKHFLSLAAENDAVLAETEKRIHEYAGRQFNIKSTKELAAVLFDELKLPHGKKTSTGYSTDINVLEGLKGKHPVIDDLILYRTLIKLKGTYIDALPRLINPDTGRIHTSYNQTVASTGRLSSSDPNLQNIPARDEFGKKIRKGFVPSPGFTMLAADYSQIELRLAAHLSGDRAMCQAFREGRDFHRETAAFIFGTDPADVTSDMRRKAKIINFSIIYGVSPFGLAKQADIEVTEAREIISSYFAAYPDFKKYIDDTVTFAREHGYVQTLFGRRRQIPDIASDSAMRREGAERMAINTPVQGTCADLIKLAMIKISDEFKTRGLRSKMILQVHDELVFEVLPVEKETVEGIVKNSMEHVLELSVPVTAELGWGSSWEEAH